MKQLRFTLLFSVDSTGFGRLNYESMSQQALMEMVFSGITNKEIFQDAHGNFLEVCEWPGVHCNEADEVEQVSYDSAEDDVWPQGIVHLEYMPSTVDDITLFEIDVDGTINFELLPIKLEL